MKEQHIAPGVSIIGFDSLDEVLEYMEEKEIAANVDLYEPQLSIGWGSKCLRVVGDEQAMLVIFGEIWTEQQTIEAETEAGSPPNEMTRMVAQLRHAYERHYRFGQWYSVVEPEGEIGSAHLSTLWPITEQDFELARQRSWVPWRELMERIYDEAAQAAGLTEGEE